MKTRTFLIMMMFLVVTSFLCAEERPFFNNDELTGTWIIDSETEQRVGISFKTKKIIIHHWGLFENFVTLESTTYVERGTLQILDKWTDSNGNTLYKSVNRLEKYSSGMYEFGRISKDGGTWEFAWSALGFPTESDLNVENKLYRIYYRQE